jgi:5-methylcytosine-specific restriction endonuclease McrA
MPIRPENRHRYPPEWKQIRAIILCRADNRCEWCQAENYKPHPKTGSRVVLTIMHLDHQPENVEYSNLKAACQRCHNRYDIPHRVAGRKQRKHDAIKQKQNQIFA